MNLTDEDARQWIRLQRTREIVTVCIMIPIAFGFAWFEIAVLFPFWQVDNIEVPQWLPPLDQFAWGGAVAISVFAVLRFVGRIKMIQFLSKDIPKLRKELEESIVNRMKKIDDRGDLSDLK